MPIITITGSDGSGKATQTQILVERAVKEGCKVKTLSFPQYEKFWGKAVRLYLQGYFGRLEEVDPHDASMLYALDRLSAKKEIVEWLNEGCNIIFDRYIESNYGHQASKYKGKEREEMIEWLYDLEIRKHGMPESDLVIYLDLPVEWTLKAIEHRDRARNIAGAKKDLHEDNAEHLLATQETYRQIAAANKDWASIPCLKREAGKEIRHTPEEVSEMVWKAAKPFLKK